MVKKETYRLQRIKPRLNKDEVFCSLCNGNGILRDVTDSSVTIGTCPHCLGEGKFQDWVKDMIGKDDGKPRRITKRYRKIRPK